MEKEINSLRLEISELKEIVLNLSIKLKQLHCSHKYIEINNDRSYHNYRSCEKCKIKEVEVYLGRGNYEDWDEYSSEN